jgi:adenylate cyclase
MKMACGACGFAASPEFAFCPKCGNRLASPGAEVAASGVAQAARPSASEPLSQEKETDRRPVTVLFADLSGFTTLSERLDPEDVRALQSDLFKEMSETIRRFDGFVEKYVGDAVMAVFGAPVAHDEDPERAVRAALTMRERVAALSEHWVRRLQQPLALHIGINTGPVVAGHIGTNRDSAYAVTGDTVNVAARLQSTAGSGEILVSQSTYLLTQHAFTFEPLGAVPLKGKLASVPVYRVEDALSAPRSARGLERHGLATSLVGRDSEMNELTAAVDRALAGRTQLVSIVGEAGAGKSRLLSEFLDRLRASGRLENVAVRTTACSSVGASTYGVPAGLLRDGYGVAPEDSPDAARQKIASALASMGADEQETQRASSFLGYVLGLETDDSRIRHLDPEQLKQQIFFTVQAVIERRLEHSPLLLIVEDLHWTDAASVDLLRFLIDRLPDRQFMLLVSHRPTEELARLAAGGTAHTLVRLEALSADHSGALLGALFGSSTQHLPDELRTRIVEHAGGNPLFLEEMVRGLIEDGVLVQEHDEWVYRAKSAAVQVPLTIHGLLLARIDRLPARARQAIQEAAVIGPVFGEQLLRQVATDAATLDEALAVLVGTGLLSEIPPPRIAVSDETAASRQYRFRHGLFHDVSYQNLLGRRRTELHTRIGESLEARYGETPQRVEELEALGHHFRLSSDKLKGADYLVKAGKWAGRIYANADAIRHYELALDTLDACSECDIERLVLTVRERLSDVLARVGERAVALEHLSTARDGYSRVDDLIAQARVLRKMNDLHWGAGNRVEAKRCVQEGLELIADGADHIERAQQYQEMGHIEYRSGDYANALEWTQRALAEAERIEAASATADEEERMDIAHAISTALNTEGVALARLDRLSEARRVLERSVEVAREARLPKAECRALANLGVLDSSQNPQRAIEACERGLETAKRIGDLGLQSRMYTNLAVAYCELTNRCEDRGVGAAHTAIEIDRRVGQLDHLTVSLVVLGQIYQCHGDPEHALAYYTEAMALAEQTGEPQLLFPCYDGLATLYLDLDDPERAERYMRKARETCERANLDPDALTVLPFLA